MENYDYSDVGEFVNIGIGKYVMISELVKLINRCEFEEEIRYDHSKPDGTLRA